jgi:hypothetical protein
MSPQPAQAGHPKNLNDSPSQFRVMGSGAGHSRPADRISAPIHSCPLSKPRFGPLRAGDGTATLEHGVSLSSRVLNPSCTASRCLGGQLSQLGLVPTRQCSGAEFSGRPLRWITAALDRWPLATRAGVGIPARFTGGGTACGRGKWRAVRHDGPGRRGTADVGGATASEGAEHLSGNYQPTC